MPKFVIERELRGMELSDEDIRRPVLRPVKLSRQDKMFWDVINV